jgi:ferric-dicitrate binding protein FerR (iron transport regulator)
MVDPSEASIMSGETCTRVRDAAAFGDGRMWLDPALLEHTEHCDVCHKEFHARKKAREFRDAFPVLTSIAAEGHRPQSTSASSTNTSEERARAARRRRVLLMFLAALSIVAFIIRRLSPRDADAPTSGRNVPFFRISNLQNAVFESKVEGGTVRSSMTRGIAAFHVGPLTDDQGFSLTLPDGELDVRGTRFVVSVDGGKTQAIEVNEGTVALRLRGHPEMLLKAGQRWPEQRAARPMVSFFPITPPPPSSQRSREAPKPSE